VIDPAQIPDEVMEAAAKHDYEVRSAAVLRDFGKALPDWADASGGTREVCRTLARAMIIAALAAWPGAEINHRICSRGTEYLILPLQEPRT